MRSSTQYIVSSFYVLCHNFVFYKPGGMCGAIESSAAHRGSRACWMRRVESLTKSNSGHPAHTAGPRFASGPSSIFLISFWCYFGSHNGTKKNDHKINPKRKRISKNILSNANLKYVQKSYKIYWTIIPKIDRSQICPTRHQDQGSKLL